MFETEDLILRKNEKNFILCLLEVARYGSRFGVQVPTIVRLEQEIQAEIEAEIEREKRAFVESKKPPEIISDSSSLVLKQQIQHSKKSSDSNNSHEDRELNSNGSYDDASASVSEEDEESMNDSASSKCQTECISQNSNAGNQNIPGGAIEKCHLNDSLENIKFDTVVNKKIIPRFINFKQFQQR